MAKKNDSIHPIFIILAFFAFLIVKIFEFVMDHITGIAVILLIALGIFLIYYILNQKSNKITSVESIIKTKPRSGIAINPKVISEKPKTRYSKELITGTNKNGVRIYTGEIDNNLPDETIIDLQNEELDLRIERERIESNQIEVPAWSHSYVYSFDEIRYATKEQKQFYYRFKELFLNGKLVDIQGNTNYAFILYFDLLNEYEKHHDIKHLEKQFMLLGETCPKTKSYTLMSLQDLLRKKGDTYSQSRLEDLQDQSYQFNNGFSNYDPDAFKLGKKYKDKLNLSQQQVAWLNKFENQYNVFSSIEGCCISIIKQYLLLLSELNKNLKKGSTTISKEVDFFKQAVFEVKEINGTYMSNYEQNYLRKNVESDIYNTIFRRVENSVRNEYGHKRKVGEFTYYGYNEEFENRIGIQLNELIRELKIHIEKPDILTQIELNSQNVNRWKIEFENLKITFQTDNPKVFFDGVTALEETNQKNPNIESIFYESSKFIAKYDKVQALQYYAKYVYYDLRSKKIDNLQLTTNIQKSLFKTNEQLIEFQVIIEKLIQTQNIQEALNEISNIFIPKRKKIVLDQIEIKAVEKKHVGTVELLTEILINGTEEVENNPTLDDKTDEELKVSFGVKTKINLIFKPEIVLNEVQEQLVLKIVHNSFIINQNEVDKFAIDNGLFKNQLIDSINEICAEVLEGEALIEEEEGNYIIDETYYLEIAN